MTEQIISSPEAPASSTRRGIGPETVTRRVLDNGLVVLIYPNTAIPAVRARHAPGHAQADLRPA
jgi:hypothetical protein